MNVRRYARGPFPFIVVTLLLVLVFISFARPDGAKSRPLSFVQDKIAAREVKTGKVFDKEQRVEIETKEGEKFRADFAFEQADELQLAIKEAGAESSGVKVSGDNVLVSLLFSLLPIAVIVFILFFVMNQMQGLSLIHI